MAKLGVSVYPDKVIGGSTQGVWRKRLATAAANPGTLHWVHKSQSGNGFQDARNLLRTAAKYKLPGVWKVVTVEGSPHVWAMLVMPAEGFIYTHENLMPSP